MTIVNPTKEAARAILDASWQKLWDDTLASLSKIEWEVLKHAALPNRQHGAFDILGGMSRHQQPRRRKAIRRLITWGLLRNVPGRGFGTISEDGLRALAEKAQLTRANEGS